MVKIRKKIPVTGSFSKNSLDDAKDTRASLENTPSTQTTVSPNPTATNPLESVLKEDHASLDIPKEIAKKPDRLSRLKKILLPLVFIILFVGVISFSVMVLRAFKERGGQTDLSDKTGEITWWGLEDPRIYEEAIRLYEASNPNAKINYIQQNEMQYVRRLGNAFGRGEGPDIFTFHNSWSKSYSDKLSVLPSELFSPDEYRSFYYPVILSDLDSDQGLVGVPLEYDGLALFMNNDIFRTAGAVEPERWDQLRPLAINLTERNTDGLLVQSGIAMGSTENVDHWQETVGLLLYQNNVDPTKPVGPNAKVVFDYYNGFSQARVWDTSLPNSVISFARGNTAMIFGTSRSARQMFLINEELNYKTIKLPQVRKDDRFSEDVGYATYWAEGVWSGSSEKGLAFDFLKFVSSPSNLQLISEKSGEIYGVQKIYPRIDMSHLQAGDPVLGSIVNIAPYSKTWFLADKTYDDPDGINSQVSAIYKEMLLNPNSLALVDAIATELVTGLNQVINFLTNPSN